MTEDMNPDTFDEQFQEPELPEDPFDPAELDAIAREVLDEMEPEEVESFFRKLEQDSVNDTLPEWRMMYGFDHECSCAVEAEEDRFVKITECYAGACQQAFDELRRARLFLYALATSPSARASTLRRLAQEAFEGA